MRISDWSSDVCSSDLELRKERKAFRSVLLASLVINLLALSLPLFSMNVYDRVIPNRAVSTLWVLGIGVLLAFAMEFALRTARTNVIDEIGRRLDIRLSRSEEHTSELQSLMRISY